MLGDASIVSWSKDSIYVSWQFNTDHPRTNQTEFRGYKIRYQAVGSSVVQYTRLLDRSASDYEITHVHEKIRDHAPPREHQLRDLCAASGNGGVPTCSATTRCCRRPCRCGDAFDRAGTGGSRGRRAACPLGGGRRLRHRYDLHRLAVRRSWLHVWSVPRSGLHSCSGLPCQVAAQSTSCQAVRWAAA